MRKIPVDLFIFLLLLARITMLWYVTTYSVLLEISTTKKGYL